MSNSYQSFSNDHQQLITDDDDRHLHLHHNVQHESHESRLSPTSAEQNQNILKGLSIAFIGAGVSYGVQSVCVSVAAENGVQPFLQLFLRSLFQVLVFLILLKNEFSSNTKLYEPNFNFKKFFFEFLMPDKHLLKPILMIIVSYWSATANSFVSFALIPPGTAIGTRGAFRAITAVVFTFLFLQSDRENKKINSTKTIIFNITVLLICCLGMSCIIYSTPNRITDLTSSKYGMDDRYVKLYGYSMAILAGFSRAVGMIVYRANKGVLSSLKIVFWHSLTSCIVSPVLYLILNQSNQNGTAEQEIDPAQKNVLLASISMLVICITATVATWSSNTAVKYRVVWGSCSFVWKSQLSLRF